MLIYHNKAHIVILLEHNVLRGGCAQSLMTLRIALCHMFSRAFMTNTLFHDVDCHINALQYIPMMIIKMVVLFAR